eukprot:912624_1
MDELKENSLDNVPVNNGAADIPAILEEVRQACGLNARDERKTFSPLDLWNAIQTRLSNFSDIDQSQLCRPPPKRVDRPVDISEFEPLSISQEHRSLQIISSVESFIISFITTSPSTTLAKPDMNFLKWAGKYKPAVEAEAFQWDITDSNFSIVGRITITSRPGEGEGQTCTDMMYGASYSKTHYGGRNNLRWGPVFRMDREYIVNVEDFGGIGLNVVVGDGAVKSSQSSSPVYQSTNHKLTIENERFEQLKSENQRLLALNIKFQEQACSLKSENDLLLSHLRQRTNDLEVQGRRLASAQSSMKKLEKYAQALKSELRHYVLEESKGPGNDLNIMLASQPDTLGMLPTVVSSSKREFSADEMDLCSASQEVKTKDDKEGGDIDLSIGMSQLNLTDPGLKARHADLEIKTVKTHDSVLKKEHEVDSTLSPNACRIYNLLKDNPDGMLVSEIVLKLNLVKKK